MWGIIIAAAVTALEDAALIQPAQSTSINQSLAGNFTSPVINLVSQSNIASTGVITNTPITQIKNPAPPGIGNGNYAIQPTQFIGNKAGVDTIGVSQLAGSGRLVLNNGSSVTANTIIGVVQNAQAQATSVITATGRNIQVRRSLGGQLAL